MLCEQRINPVNITRISGAVATLVLAGMLASCQQPATPQAQETAAATAAPEAKPGLSLTDGRLVLPIIAGRPGAVYFAISNSGDKPASVASAYVEGAANAEIHETKGGSMAAVSKVDIAPGKTVEFAPGGLHVMAFELPDSFQEGGTTELTISFADGDKISAPLTITTAAANAADADGHSAHDHGAAH